MQVCRQLGFGHSTLSSYGSYAGSGAIWLDHVQCTGDEPGLESCTHGGWGNVRSVCSAAHDVWVSCAGGASFASLPLPLPPPPLPPPPRPSPPPPWSPASIPGHLCDASCPQTLGEVSAITDVWRSELYAYPNDYTTIKTDHSGSTGFSGSTAALAKWHRFVDADEAALRMPTAAPDEYRCGGRYPGWLRDSHPSVGGVKVAAEVCFARSSNQCYYKRTIEVCACSYDGGSTATMVYKLPRSPVNQGVYCSSAMPLPPPLPPLPPPQSPRPITPPSAPWLEGNVRLAGGPSAWRGRVEIFHDWSWRSICGYYYSDGSGWQGWGSHEGDVVRCPHSNVYNAP